MKNFWDCDISDILHIPDRFLYFLILDTSIFFHVFSNSHNRLRSSLPNTLLYTLFVCINNKHSLDINVCISEIYLHIVHNTH